jgi:hypothetical protein
LLNVLQVLTVDAKVEGFFGANMNEYISNQRKKQLMDDWRITRLV